MLWNASALTGYAIVAADGQPGTVAGLMYDESDWSIKWLEVDTGNWLSGQRALLPVSALAQPDPDARHLPVRLTMRQIEECPDFDRSVPLSRDREDLFLAHYDPRGERHDGQHAATIALTASRPSTATADLEAGLRDTGIHDLSELTGHSIEATDGDIGHAEDFLIDTAFWRVRYLAVHSSSWWTDEKRVISPLSIDWIDRARSIIHLNVTCQKVKDSPPYDAAETVDGAFDELFHSYYGIRWVRR